MHFIRFEIGDYFFLLTITFFFCLFCNCKEIMSFTDPIKNIDHSLSNVFCVNVINGTLNSIKPKQKCYEL